MDEIAQIVSSGSLWKKMRPKISQKYRRAVFGSLKRALVTFVLANDKHSLSSVTEVANQRSLLSAFNWRNTDEGYQFWEAIHTKMNER